MSLSMCLKRCEFFYYVSKNNKICYVVVFDGAITFLNAINVDNFFFLFLIIFL